MPEQVCKLYRKVAYSHTGEKTAIFTRLRCKQWSCPSCAKKNASIWRAFLKEKLPNVSTEWWLLTLTASPNTTTEQGSIDNLRSNIEKLVKRAKRVFGRLNYVRTFERHPSSRRVHAHFIISGLLPYVGFKQSRKGIRTGFGSPTRKGRKGFWGVRTWFKINARGVGIGYICDVRPIKGDTTQAVLYVCKYLTKAQQDLKTKGLRHVQTTRDIGSPKEKGDMDWTCVPYITARMFAPNANIMDLNTGEIIDNSYWEVHSFYPYED